MSNSGIEQVRVILVTLAKVTAAVVSSVPQRQGPCSSGFELHFPLACCQDMARRDGRRDCYHDAHLVRLKGKSKDMSTGRRQCGRGSRGSDGLDSTGHRPCAPVADNCGRGLSVG